MKKLLVMAVAAMFYVACQPAEESAPETSVFDENCATVRAVVDDFQNEVADFEHYSADFIRRQSKYNTTGDSIGLEQFKTNRLNWWAKYDAKLLNDLRLLPGVNPRTLETDGSVRYYAQWQITKTATDSTEAKSIQVPLYVSFDFDAEGKILFQQVYGDMTAAFQELNN